MKNKIDVFGLTYEKLVKNLLENNFQKFRAQQIFKWLYEKNTFDFNLMTDIAIPERIHLNEIFDISLNDRVEIFNSKKDSSSKFLFKFKDESAESVLMPERDRTTVCLSSQTGCFLKCSFCATGKKSGRNLSSGEIIRQFVYMARESKERITNVVFMGMGEPMLNMENVLEAVNILNCDKGIRIGARKITISTAGIIPGIDALTEFPLQVKLAVSLNSAIQAKREILMPIAKTYDLISLKKAIRKYQDAKNKRITFEYILIPEFNDFSEDVNAIFDYVKGIDCKINIIPYNPIDSQFRAPSKKEINSFFERLSPLKDAVTIRESRGRDINGACGQLAGKHK
ncbi:TPA: 23S rRNA (adenine(2503)-C(2))-methyltransferase RlmN [candidate division WOR-3 bacterium]|jgi:23S rRNA (adenine2503-C2)-methyltransferase|uniref:23S rRNA (Adenine(2503)-C(2))-methyltransferase RlmN n=1 Tax=candidate division WOR-3 bacterium TaxID=2052148 RepID=A0A350H9R4_UNCW3|nr:23S rRNA (adenine(2503)-C(2))-methyltransferase RlmN [candidate division WOR-3 bacterium]